MEEEKRDREELNEMMQDVDEELNEPLTDGELEELLNNSE
jgi:hypothetical protein